MTAQEAPTTTSTSHGQPSLQTISYHQSQIHPLTQHQTQPRSDYQPNARPQKRILLINGPNLNLLGHREPAIYGSTTLSQLTSTLTTLALDHDVALDTFQSNHEGLLLDRIHACLLGYTIESSISTTSPLPTPFSSSPLSPDSYNPDITSITAGKNADATTATELRRKVARPDAIIINPGAWTHTSVALRDALLGVGVPFIEVHISNVHAREEFRHRSYLSDKAEAVICGLGTYGYEAALSYWVRKWA